MIKLKDILFESTAPDIFIPRRMENRVDRYIKQYIRDGSKGKLNISYMYLTKLPEILKNMEIDGDFSCEGNDIESLENFPKSVGLNFACSNNPVRFTEKQVRAVCYVRGVVFV